MKKYPSKLQMVLSYAYCNASIMPLRQSPSHRAEQVTEMLWGERAEILEINEQEWALIRCEWDGYEGWCRFGQLTVISKKEYRKAPKYLSAKHTDKVVFEESEQWLPMGSDLLGMKGSRLCIYNMQGRYKGRKLAIKDLEPNTKSIKAAALHYMNAPYLWGGRTIAGIDCSGLTQMAYKLCGKTIPRDAYQQATVGETIDFLQQAHCGDLAFFDNTEGRITHVGILLDEHTIIHSSEINGRVAIDRIDAGGIISTNLKRRTHNLRVVKRLF